MKNKADTTMKVRKSTRKALRLISAMTGKTMSEIVDNLAAQELAKIQESGKNVHTPV